MKLSILNRLIHEKGWEICQKRQGHVFYKHTNKLTSTCIIVPMGSAEQVPIGTLNATLKAAHQKGQTGHWTSAFCPSETIPAILEKQAGGLWARIELPGLVAATRGCSADCVINSLRTLLLNFATDEDPACLSALTNVRFRAVYDTTAVWDMLKQIRANHIADKAGIDTDLIGQFMTGATFPCVDQATRLEASIHELGRQLMQISIR